jgi:hypothetical protein
VVRVKEIRDMHVYQHRKPTPIEIENICKDQRWDSIAMIKKDIAIVRVWGTADTRERTINRASQRMTEKYDTTAQKKAVYRACFHQIWPTVAIDNNIAFADGVTGRGIIITFIIKLSLVLYHTTVCMIMSGRFYPWRI